MRAQKIKSGSGSQPCLDPSAYHRSLAGIIARRATPLVVGAGLLAGAPAHAANFNPSNVSELIADMTTANSNGEDDVIDLGGNFFELTGINNTTAGNTGLPVVVEDGFTLTIANGTITRDSAAPSFRILHVVDTGSLTLQNTIISGGIADDTVTSNVPGRSGGGIFNRGVLALDTSTVSGNTASYRGGGLFNYGADVTITDSTISVNSAGLNGGGIRNGGRSTVRLSNSTVSGNSAGNNGGGISNYRYVALNLSNTTISGNSAANGGGAVHNYYYSSATLINSTLAGNTGVNGAAFYNEYDSSATFINSLVVNNDGGNNCQDPTFTFVGSNFSDDASCPGFTENAAAGTNLGLLDNNGGPTLTHLLLTGNPAIDGGDQSQCDANGIASDQRGTARPLDGNGDGTAICDAGALERVRRIIVDSSFIVDPTDGDGQCSLVEAIHNANDNVSGQPYTDCDPGLVNGPDTISLPNGNYFNFSSANDTTDGANALPSITSEITIQGNGARLIRRSSSGTPGFRILHLADTGNLVLQNTTITGGVADGAAGLAQSGAGIFNRGTLTLENSTVSGNTANNRGGGIYNYRGSGINFSEYGVATITGSMISDNSAMDGGGLFVNGSLTLSNSQVQYNNADREGGGLRTGISSTLTVTGSTLSRNSANSNGGGLSADYCTLSLTNSTVSHNVSGKDGGGMYLYGDDSAIVTNSTISGNSAAEEGGGIFNYYYSPLSLIHSTLSGNSASTGGGIYNQYASLTLTNSLIVNSYGGNCHDDMSSFSEFNVAGNNFADDASCTGIANTPAAGDYLSGLYGHDNATATHLLFTGNPAIDGADQAACDAGGITTDQRGTARPLDGNGDGSAICDAGAVEAVINPIIVDAGVVDPTDGDGQCSLVEAIGNANDTGGGQPFADCGAANAGGLDTVYLPAGSTFSFTADNDNSNGANALPSITSQITIAGNGATLARDPASGNDFRLIHVADTGRLILMDATLTGGYAGLAADSGDKGGAIANRGYARLARVTLSDNSAAEDGGAIWNAYSLLVRESTISGNSAARGGGGIYNDGSVAGDAILINSTLSGNDAYEGGGISNRNGSVTLANSTLAENTASLQGGGIHNAYAYFTAGNSLIVNNSIGNCNNYSSTTYTFGVNLANDASCIDFTSDPAAGDLGPLANNGGPTQTHLPQSTNPAIEGGDQAICDAVNLATDQRGLASPKDGDGDGTATCDVGAVEAFIIAPIAVAAGVVDPIDGDGQCSLVEAIQNANDTDNLGQPFVDCARGNYNGADTLTLPNASTFTFTSANDTTDGANALPSITSAITIEGNDSVIQRDTGSGDAFRVVHISAGGSLVLQDAQISGGRVTGGGFTDTGAGILNRGSLSLSNSTISGNSAEGTGGGIAHNNASASITNSSISGNIGDQGGAGMEVFDSYVNVSGSTFSGNTATGFYGGGILNGGTSDSNSTLNLTNSTISGNSSGNYGGGIGATSSTNNLTNTTVSGNTAAYGGGLIANFATVNLTHSTVFGNSANYAGGLSTFSASVDAAQSLFGGNTNGNCAIQGGGSFNSVGMNLADDASCPGFTNTPAAADMAPLADNGGPTQTHLPLASNPAVDAFDCTVPVADQRGIARPQDGNLDQQALCDVGAVELEPDNTDSDSDGIADAYEQAFGLTVGVDDSGGDIDTDGLSNLDEFNAGTAANNPDSDGDGLGDNIDADPVNASNACIQDGNGDAQFDFTAMSGMTTQCAADNSITVLDAANAVIEPGAILQLYSLSVSFELGAAVPVGAGVQTIIGDPAPGMAP